MCNSISAFCYPHSNVNSDFPTMCMKYSTIFTNSFCLHLCVSLSAEADPGAGMPSGRWLGRADYLVICCILLSNNDPSLLG